MVWKISWSLDLSPGAYILHIVYGSRNPFGAIFDVTKINGTNGFSVVRTPQGSFDALVSPLGDFNGDGVDDFMLRGIDNSTNGTVYFHFGNSTRVSSAIGVTNLNGNNGFRLYGPPSSYCGNCLTNVGDFNNDGYDDAALCTKMTTQYNSTVHYLLYGTDQFLGSAIEMAVINRTNGFIVEVPGTLIRPTYGKLGIRMVTDFKIC